VLSSATFTSLMRLLAAVRLSFDTPSCSWYMFNAAWLAPTVARSEASWLMAFFTLVNAVTALVVDVRTDEVPLVTFV